MIQQIQYTPTTTKYNFPHTLKDIASPTRFIELSLHSIKNIQNCQAELYQPYETLAGIDTHFSEEFSPPIHHSKIKFNLTSLKPLQKKTPVIAIDVSSINIGETTTGILLAIRGAIVWNNQHHYRYLRVGPFPFHITEENKREIYTLFRQYSFETVVNHNINPPSLIHMQARMTTLLERWLQMNVITQSQNSLILWDGSLTAGTIDSPTHVVLHLLKTARNRLNSVIAFSKFTRLRFSGQRITDLIERYDPPCLLEIIGYSMPTSNAIKSLGNMYVVKLSKGNCSFRVDVDRQLPREQAVAAIQRLIANDQLSESYPETLRLAHIYSTFTANEVIAIQRFLAQSHHLKIRPRPSARARIRRLLFGPFGKGPES